jgi:xylulokinase
MFLGLDLGTSRVKAGLFDRSGRLHRLARRGYPLHIPRPGWAEQEPADWWSATSACLQEILANGGAAQIAAVGLSGQAPGQVLVTSRGEALGRALVWCDRRAMAEAQWLAGQMAVAEAEAWTGFPLVPSATQPAARLLWFQRHRTADWQQCAAVLQPKDYLIQRLTGQIVTDLNSGGDLLHTPTGRYHPEYLRLLGVDSAKMPPAVSPESVVGEVLPEAADQTGLLIGTPVVVGTIDAWCGILGCGGVVPGCAVDLAGTSEVVGVVTAGPVKEEGGIMSASLAEGLYWVGGPMQTGGAALDWLVGAFYGGEGGYDRLEAAASAVGPGAEGLLFLPHLRGERAPHWDDRARAAFVGLTDRHDRGHCARAVYEGVAFAVADMLERCLTVSGLHRTRVLRVSGGGVESAFWNQIKADVVGLPVQLMAPESACLGAAMLAAIGVAAFSGLQQAARSMVRPGATIAPRIEHQELYAALLALWKGLYPTLRATMSELSTLTEGRTAP